MASYKPYVVFWETAPLEEVGKTSYVDYQRLASTLDPSYLLEYSTHDPTSGLFIFTKKPTAVIISSNHQDQLKLAKKISSRGFKAVYLDIQLESNQGGIENLLNKIKPLQEKGIVMDFLIASLTHPAAIPYNQEVLKKVFS